jgi:hypothetical protein
MFVTLYTYDAAGQPTWLVASNCPVVAGRCAGPLYRVTGGQPPNVAWGGAMPTAREVGDVELAFETRERGSLAARIDGLGVARSISRQPFAGEGAPAARHADVFEAFLSGSFPGYRERGLAVSDGLASTSVGCGTSSFSDRGQAEGEIARLGGRVTVSTPAQFCAALGAEAFCMRQFESVVVYQESFDGRVEYIETIMTGLLPGQNTTVQFYVDEGMARVYSVTRDPFVSATGPCPNRDEPAPPASAIDGDWVGYSLRYDPAGASATLGFATLTCASQRCTLIGPTTTAFTFTGSTAWRTGSTSQPFAGAAMSADRSLVSLFTCPTPLVESRAFESCTFFSLRRPE